MHPFPYTARYYLRSMSSKVIESTYDDIINSFDSKKQIIHTLVKAATSEQIKSIIKILKVAHAAELAQNNNKIISVPPDYHHNNHGHALHTAYFDRLADENIFEICEFLDKPSLACFKVTSCLHALIAFDVMQAYTVGVLNMRNLLSTQCSDKPITQFSINHNIIFNRFKVFTKNKVLLSVYSKRYNIEQDHLFMLISMYSKFFDNNQSLLSSCVVQPNTEWQQTKISKSNVFFVFDKSEIYTLNNSNKLLTMNKVYKCEEMKNYAMVMLQYFDAGIRQQSQQLINVCFVWLDLSTKPERLYDFIVNHLPKTACSDIFGDCLNKMKLFGAHPDIKLVDIYENENWQLGVQSIKYRPYAPICSRSSLHMFKIITFQINLEHPYWIAQLHDVARDKNRTFPFCRSIVSFMSNKQQQYHIQLKNVENARLIRQQLAYFNVLQDEEKHCHIGSDLNLCVWPSSTFQMLKLQICARFNSLIPTQHIQVYSKYADLYAESWADNTYTIDVDLDERQIGKKENDFSNIFYWELVPYDATLRSTNNGVYIYRVSIYEPQRDAVFEYLREATHFNLNCSKYFHASLTEQVEQKNATDDEDEDDDVEDTQSLKGKQVSSGLQFAVNDFMCHLMETLQHPMYGDEYASILKKYNRENARYYSFIIMHQNHDAFFKHDCCCYTEEDVYRSRDEYLFSKLVKKSINVFIVENVGDFALQQSKNHIPVIVVFSKLEKYQSGFIPFNTTFGYPMKTYVSPTDTPLDLKQKCKEKMKNPDNFAVETCFYKMNKIGANEIILDKVGKHYQNIPTLLLVLKNKRDTQFNL